ncbi:AmmeMemoRadiSam system radical SAM enzyme [Desulfitibacter alkalitolerans]|uniref:AmmeMemoRadiSam system radical SAM enzyme n=1 Tax=Desulfitibacter alkalitolerans TaxID=264641 RepID=UPI0004822AF2|nr:AmmeMemoRadiSam system radical SAM enzyme [Desulfitibacter alkalitolerans]
MHLASWAEKQDNERVLCLLCPHACSIPQGEKGKCRVRVNRKGNLYSENYGKVTAVNVDPIEKKPLYHFYPGKNILSIGTFGCNLHCDFCQNWQIAHAVEQGKEITPEEVAEISKMYYVNQNSLGVAYTYSEPGMWYEFIKDTAPLIKEGNMKNVLVTNGFLNRRPFKELLVNIDALNIDVKGFADEFYKKIVKGKLKPVLENCYLAREMACHLEITTLIIPGLNDDEHEIRDLAKWLASIDPLIPLHLSRYYPNYKLQLEPTPLKTLERAWETAKEYLNYVYIGNAPELDKCHTYCSECNALLIERTFYNTRLRYGEGACPKCSKQVKGVID